MQPKVRRGARDESNVDRNRRASPSGIFVRRTNTAMESPHVDQNDETSFRDLAALAIRAAPNGWALVQRDRLCATNPAFAQIEQASASEGPWRRITAGYGGADLATSSYPHLQALVLGETRRLRASGHDSNRARFARLVQTVDVWVQGSAAPEGTMLVFVQNVTKLARAEARAAAFGVQLQRQEKLRTLGELAFGIVHDLNNVLGALSWRLAVIEADKVCRQAQSSNIDALRRIVTACMGAVARIGSAARSDAVAIASVDLTEIVSASVDIAETSFRIPSDGRESVRIRTTLPELPKVTGSPEDLLHLFINLLINARDAMPAGGTITVIGAYDGELVTVKVEDEGTGIPAASLEQIFEPFFTTKGLDGSGMGLAVARETMRRLGGSISASNRPAGGACFELRFVPAG